MAMITTVDRAPFTTSHISEAAPTVFAVHNDVPVRESLELLARESGWRCETFASAREFLARPRSTAPGCLILDVGLPDVNGLDLQKHVAVERPELPVIFITQYGDVHTGVEAMKAGAIEFLTKPFEDEELLSAMRHALERSSRALEHAAKTQALRKNYAALTPRERDVMVLVASGLLNKQVGDELGISEITVKAHRGQVMRKMKAGSLPALVHMVDWLDGVAQPRGFSSRNAFSTLAAPSLIASSGVFPRSRATM